MVAPKMQHRSQKDDRAVPPSDLKSSTAERREDDNPLERLRNRILQPIKERVYPPINRVIAKLGYAASVVLFLGLTSVTGLVVGAWKHPAEVKRACVAARYYLEARRDRPTADARVGVVVRDLINQLEDDISPSNRNRADGKYEAWDEAQIVVSLQGRGVVDPRSMQAWFQNQMASSNGWREFSQNLDDPEHLGATGWILLSYAKMGVSTTPKQIGFVLENQHTAGWWPIFPATDDPNNACTYATALSLWALQELMNHRLISEPQRGEVANAISKGRDWLLNNAVPDKPGVWRDYPAADYGQESLGVSGLVLHVLHRTGGPTPVEADKYWMAHLPEEMPEVGKQTSTSQTVVTQRNRPVPDPTHNFSFPWLVIGTIDAYREGTLLQRAQAARLLHQIPDKRREIFINAKQMPWLAAEILVSVRYLEGENVI